MKLRFGLIALGCALALAGCQTASTATAGAEPARGLLVGSVAHAAPDPVIVVVLERATNRIVHRAFLEKRRLYRLPLEAGSYKVFAFADTDRDGSAGAEELVSATYSVATPLAAGEVLELPSLPLTQTLASAR